MAIRTARVDVAEIFALRHSVLLPGRPPAEAEFAEDGAPGAFHLAAYDPRGAVAACVSFCPELLPGDDTPAYRFRGMASAPAARGEGYGVAVLDAGLAEAAARGAHLVWCNARTSAAGFYLKRGFEVRGAEFVIEGVGPHVVMTTKPTTGA
ncbi:GNAT family N-acetyltransferase [Streptomyces sp. WMMC500]|uniref:GNAT family N-acetyltransferase n=1 Tax=Streptomyces sp. WMMC500 TaxID=3015154 RepID=UPI00248CB4ED|nr:GNAT family N-acetyltransferase [Streptomyces sp. WMMC500]WBB59482.1 GNAT family N-acetyltransferase [Streptomyces sp. WMMC500]